MACSRLTRPIKLHMEVHTLLYAYRPSSYVTTSRAYYSAEQRHSQSHVTLRFIANFRALQVCSRPQYQNLEASNLQFHIPH